MRSSSVKQLHAWQVQPCTSICAPRRPVLQSHLTSRIAARAKKGQKNEGVYFEYEAVDPDAANEIAALEEEDAEAFSWARRSREQKQAAQDKFRKIDRKVFGADDGRRKGKGGKRKPGLSPKEKREVAAEAAAAMASDGPVLAPFSPVETPAMRKPTVTPDELLNKPSPPRPGAPPAQPQPQPRPPTAASAQTATPSAGTSAPSTSSSQAPKAEPAAAARGSGAAGSDRRQRLLQRMKGTGGSGAASGEEAAGSASTSSGIGTATPADEAAVGPAGPSSSAPSVSGAEASSPPTIDAKRVSPFPVAGPSAVAAGAAGAAAATAAVAAMVSGPSLAGGAAAGADAASQVSAAADDLPPLREAATLPPLDADLPAEEQLPAEARPARALLASILSPSQQELRDVTGGDVMDMLERDMAAQREFREWASCRRVGGASASSAAGPASGAPGQAVADDEGEGEGIELTDAELADLEAAIASLGLDDAGALAAELGLEEEAEEGDVAGDADVRTAMREVSELRSLMAQMDEEPEQGDDEAIGDLTDEQVIAALKTRDPALYELLKDVPEFDKLDLDLDLDLDLASASGQLTEAELAELAAEAAGGAGGRDDAAELEELLSDMRGMGLIRADGNDLEDDDGGAGDDDIEEDDDDDDGDLGDLLEAIDEDEEIDPRARLQAQYALKSMFNQPADELLAKGTRGSGPPAASGKGVGRGKAKAAGDEEEEEEEEEDAGAGAVPPAPRGTTGMARGSVSKDDEDGGAAPPPLLPRPPIRPKPAQ